MPRNLPYGIPTGAQARTFLAGLGHPVPPAAPYNRNAFGSGWSTVDNCDMRQWVLATQALKAGQGAPVAISPPQTAGITCPITAGSWEDPYQVTPLVLSYHTAADLANGVDIDHIVPLKVAWDSGASLWAADMLRDFANDLSEPELLTVSADLNNQKSDQTPDQWVPPNAGLPCDYAEMYVEVKSVRPRGSGSLYVFIYRVTSRSSRA